ncbi:Aminodeoxychorismate synthase component 2 [Planctomycetes bacterium Poly30]|uniref:Aminodeoxychorismate synthase component 2 n=1 Tax=Saltatorellus ferox TaxID=2528018 RepID=A0A518EV37_9BACT|nr:Aminodeoxychorismate synthase component 2 [Planctomycetes bacterium Poly30]
MILLIDNYDSFAFNLYQALSIFGSEVRVVRNDEITVAEALALAPDAVVISPGPGRPKGAGIVLELLRALPDRMPVLGVCLGHQALVESEGGELEVDAVPVHGKSSSVTHGRTGLFSSVESPMTCGRYHSLRAVRASLPASLRIAAETSDGAVMAVEHNTLPRFGVQFHPESILTPRGSELLARFVELAGLELRVDAAAAAPVIRGGMERTAGVAS